MESIKKVLKNLFTGWQGRNRHREWTNEHGERGGKGEMYGKSNMETHITICKISSQQEFGIWLSVSDHTIMVIWAIKIFFV